MQNKEKVSDFQLCILHIYLYFYSAVIGLVILLIGVNNRELTESIILLNNYFHSKESLGNNLSC